MLLLVVPLLVILGNLMEGMTPSILDILRTVFYNAVIILIIAAVFSLAFLIASILKRNPQLQYFIELLVALCIIIYLPTY